MVFDVAAEAMPSGGNRKLRNIVASRLILDWSPEQISRWLKIKYPDDQSMHVSHETIYRSLFIQARGPVYSAGQDRLDLGTGRVYCWRSVAAFGGRCV